MSRTLRYLRIGWSVFFSIAAALLVALWIRSYWWADFTKFGEVASCRGMLHFHQTISVHVETGIFSAPYALERIGFYTLNETNVTVFARNGDGPAVPTWIPAICAMAMSAVPWLPCRFSLRTLLIVTTLVAVGLGIIVWMSRA